MPLPYYMTLLLKPNALQYSYQDSEAQYISFEYDSKLKKKKKTKLHFPPCFILSCIFPAKVDLEKIDLSITFVDSLVGLLLVEKCYKSVCYYTQQPPNRVLLSCLNFYRPLFSDRKDCSKYLFNNLLLAKHKEVINLAIQE